VERQEAAHAVAHERHASARDAVWLRESLRAQQHHRRPHVLERVDEGEVALAPPGAPVVEEQHGPAGPPHRLGQVEVALVSRKAVQEHGGGMGSGTLGRVQDGVEPRTAAVHRHLGHRGAMLSIDGIGVHRHRVVRRPGAGRERADGDE